MNIGLIAKVILVKIAIRIVVLICHVKDDVTSDNRIAL
jgi:hypothetical protein